MHPLQIKLLPSDLADSPPVRELKAECNRLITQYNQLANPFQLQAQELVFAIAACVMKLHRLREVQQCEPGR